MTSSRKCSCRMTAQEHKNKNKNLPVKTTSANCGTVDHTCQNPSTAGKVLAHAGSERRSASDASSGAV